MRSCTCCGTRVLEDRPLCPNCAVSGRDAERPRLELLGASVARAPRWRPWRGAGAMVIDVLVLWLPYLALTTGLSAAIGRRKVVLTASGAVAEKVLSSGTAFALLAVFVLASVAYFALFNGPGNGQTVGRRALRLRGDGADDPLNCFARPLRLAGGPVKGPDWRERDVRLLPPLPVGRHRRRREDEAGSASS